MHHPVECRFADEFQLVLNKQPSNDMRKKIQKTIDDMTAEGVEAPKEPRYWRRPWNNELSRRFLFPASMMRKRAQCANEYVHPQGYRGIKNQSTIILCTLVDKICRLSKTYLGASRSVTVAFRGADGVCAHRFHAKYCPANLRPAP